MKRNLLWIVLGMSLIASVANAQLEQRNLGELTLAGKACSTQELMALISKGKIIIPMHARFLKSAQDEMFRSSCNFALPIEVPDDKRLILKDMNVRHRLDLPKGNMANTQIEVFLAGSQGAKIQDVITARFYKRRLDRVLTSSSEIETGCGEDIILRGNNSVLIEGETSASVQIPNIKLDYELEDCR